MRILLDLDEVLVDFVGGACKAFNVTREDHQANWTLGVWDMIPPLEKVRGHRITPEFFWAVIHQQGERFWEELEPLPWMGSVLNLVASITDDWHVISAPSKCPTSYNGKVKWLKNFLGKGFDRFALTPHKYIFAGKDTLLIDDRDQNVIDFTSNGGDGLVFPRHHNSLHMLKNDPVGHLRRMLLPKGAENALQISGSESGVSGTSSGNPRGYDPDQAV